MHTAVPVLCKRAFARAISSGPRPITVVGSVCMDNFIETARLPLPGETLAGNPLGFVRMPGGKGANQAAGCSSLGAPTSFVSRLGLDDDGEICKACLAEFGVNLDHLELVDGVPSGQVTRELPESNATCLLLATGRGSCFYSLVAGTA